MSRHKTTGQNHYLKVANKLFKNVVKFRYLRMTLTNQNCIHEEIEWRLNFGNSCYHAVPKLLSSYLVSKSIKIKIYKTIILFYLLSFMGVRPGLSHQRKNTDWVCLRTGYWNPGGMKWWGWRKLHNKELHNLYSSPNIIRVIKSRRMRWVGHVAHMVEVRNVNTLATKIKRLKCSKSQTGSDVPLFMYSWRHNSSHS
jgi:hypothetical protein